MSTHDRVRPHGMPTRGVRGMRGGVPPARRRARPLVLVACADRDTRAICATWLRHVGYAVRVAEHADAAMALAVAHAPDVVVTSHPLYAADGSTLTARLRRTRGLRRIPVLSLASWVRADDLAAAAGAGVDESLLMPVSLPVLRDAVARLASARR